MMYSLFISTARGLEYLLKEEAETLGFAVERVSPQGIYGQASLALIYHLCLWLRVANRVHILLAQAEAHSEKSLYQLAFNVHWQEIFSVDKTFAIDFHGSSAVFRHTLFGAQVIKDAIVDYFVEHTGTRPSVDKAAPNIRLHAHLHHGQVSLSLDVVGYSLHQRGYRLAKGIAPLKETLAAALLIRAQWPEKAALGQSFFDPFCGSGTLVIEAALMAANIAPGLLRRDQSFCHWLEHDEALWQQTRQAALSAQRPPKNTIQGCDNAPYMTVKALDNAKRAEVADLVEFKTRDFADITPATPPGLILTNPPFGERMADETALIPLYQRFGQTVHQRFQGWQLYLLTSSAMLAKALGLRAHKQYAFYNGALACKLYGIRLDSENTLQTHQETHFSPAALMLFNRLQKNQARLSKWLKRTSLDCYRLYDADLPEYAFAVDYYNGYVVLQEYAPPAIIPEHKAEKRRLDMLSVLPKALDIAADNIIFKERARQKGREQYQKQQASQRTVIVHEPAAQFQVNLSDYLDTGLFLDHRLLRQRFGTLAPDTRFLNCFCYTATASVHAALAGATTTNVDLSNTYLTWAKENFRINGLSYHAHQFIQADCLSWLNNSTQQFDVIFLDPPSFSNSKRMDKTLDIQRDHCTLIHAAMRLLAPRGTLYFSTNLRRFKLDDTLLTRFQIKDITAATIDMDFKRRPSIHHCYVVQARSC